MSPVRAADPPASFTLAGTARDFEHRTAVNSTGPINPDFGRSQGRDPGFVGNDLGADGKPVYIGGNGTETTHGAAAFNQWYRDVPGVNIAVPLVVTAVNVAGANNPQYAFSNKSFFPLDGKGWNDPSIGNGVGQVDHGHNFSFTFELHTTFTYRGGETFAFRGDDDVFVFINRKLALDRGGVRPTQTGSVALDDLGLTKGNTYDFALFFAERAVSRSELSFLTSIPLAQTGEPDPTATTIPPATTTTTRPTTATTVRAAGVSSGSGTGSGSSSGSGTKASTVKGSTVQRLMARTGAQVMAELTIGFALLAAGLALRRTNRRRVVPRPYFLDPNYRRIRS